MFLFLFIGAWIINDNSRYEEFQNGGGTFQPLEEHKKNRNQQSGRFEPREYIRIYPNSGEKKEEHRLENDSLHNTND
ncbi:hypothetical protein BTS2_2899 [Bacillus sp. TS-2]|nr:hypothetical protein BTS2_2899 [Bacillus sp. TS-2]